MRATVSNAQRKTPLSASRIERDSLRALRYLRLQGAELSVMLVGSARMRRLNRDYRGIDRTTDVLSFPMNELGGGLAAYRKACLRESLEGRELHLGDVVIDPARAAEQAALYGHTLRAEIRRLLAHGILHLLGYDHEQGGAEAARMRRMETKLGVAMAR